MAYKKLTLSSLYDGVGNKLDDCTIIDRTGERFLMCHRQIVARMNTEYNIVCLYNGWGRTSEFSKRVVLFLQKYTPFTYIKSEQELLHALSIKTILCYDGKVSVKDGCWS